MRRLALLAIVLTTTFAQAQTPSLQKDSLPCTPGNALIGATLWVQSSAEFRASALQTYNVARRMVDLALKDRTWSATGQTNVGKLPTAVILDLDETVFDNIKFETRAIKSGVAYSTDLWTAWMKEPQAGALPGVKDFIEYLRTKKVTPFFITNRKAKEEAVTRQNVIDLGLPILTGIDPEHPEADNLFTREERPEWMAKDKGPRRDWVSNHYRVLLLLGDDLNDFMNAAEKTEEERYALVASTSENWGTKWLILPNPIYGSWNDIIVGKVANGCEELEKKFEALKP